MTHFTNWIDFLREHTRVLKKDGYIIYNMVNDEHLKKISKNRVVRASYITDTSDYFATVSRGELEEACQEIGNVQLVKMIPYDFFKFSSFLYGILTRKELVNLGGVYNAMCKDSDAATIIERFEMEIISKLPETMTACNICVLKKVKN